MTFIEAVVNVDSLKHTGKTKKPKIEELGELFDTKVLEELSLNPNTANSSPQTIKELKQMVGMIQKLTDEQKKRYLNTDEDTSYYIKEYMSNNDLAYTDDDIEIEGYSLTGKEVIDWAEKHRADILILDINMPHYDGIEVLKFFKLKKINLKVIILSSYDDVKLVEEMLSLGASGFLSKDSAGEHIINAIKAVHEGEQYFSDAIKNNLLKLYTGQKL